MEKNPSKSDPPEINEHDQSTEDTTGVGRSYECTFCKRGFTNAQALGGHMNIHRKDKAKAKLKNRDEPSKKFPEMSYFSSPHDQQQSGYYGGHMGGQVNYQVYLPSSNPNAQKGNYLPLWKQEHDFDVDSNLNLKIGMSSEGDDGRNIVKENEVDLELRLGHDPR